MSTERHAAAINPGAQCRAARTLATAGSIGSNNIGKWIAHRRDLGLCRVAFGEGHARRCVGAAGGIGATGVQLG